MSRHKNVNVLLSLNAREGNARNGCMEMSMFGRCSSTNLFKNNTKAKDLVELHRRESVWYPWA